MSESSEYMSTGEIFLSLNFFLCIDNFIFEGSLYKLRCVGGIYCVYVYS